jgi:hypothetical protein
MIAMAAVLAIFFNIYRYAELKDVSHVHTWAQYFRYNSNISVKLNVVIAMLAAIVWLTVEMPFDA